MVNLGVDNFPGRHARKLHLILFFSPFCAHCQTVEPLLLHISQALQAEHDIVVGAIDCANRTNQGVCRQHNITGYPSIFAIGWRHLVQYQGGAAESEIQSWFDKVRSRRSSRSSGGSAECPSGLFAGHKSVVPLCVDHFPDEAAKHPWLVVLYKMQHDLREPVVAAAKDLGRQGRKKQRERLSILARRYDLEVKKASEQEARGMESSDAFAKVGALCCDCRQDEQPFCKDLQKRWRSRRLPLVVWVFKGQTVLEDAVQARGLVIFALSELGLVVARGRGRSEL